MPNLALQYLPNLDWMLVAVAGRLKVIMFPNFNFFKTWILISTSGDRKFY